MSLFVLAGEPSGDLHGHRVLETLKRKRPDLKVEGIGGPKMRAAGLTSFLPMEEFQVIGFADVIRAFPRLMRNFKKTLGHILATQPDAVLLIDYPGFNLRLAKALRKKGYRGKLIQYICPQVWIWFKGDIKKMVDTLDLLLLIFPFEAPLFDKTPLKAHYVGHPCQELLDDTVSQKNSFSDALILGLFPGSRPDVIARNLPLQLEVAKQLKEEHPQISMYVSVANKEAEKVIASLVPDPLSLVAEKDSYALMASSTLALASSGTVALELCLRQTPTVVLSPYSNFDSWIAKHVHKVAPPICIVNIIAKKSVFPELSYPNLTRENLLVECRTLLENRELREQCRRDCQEVKQALKVSNLPSENVADLISQTIAEKGEAPQDPPHNSPAKMGEVADVSAGGTR